MRTCYISILIFLTSAAFGQSSYTRSTVTYFKNDTLFLDLDLCMPEVKPGRKLPLVLFAHGGGFSSGKRQDGDSLCVFLAKNGFAAATISYTLYMGNKSFGCDGIVSEKIKAIQFGVSDLWAATTFFITNKDRFNIDTDRIFIAGSSAGGEMALHAAFWDFNLMNMYPQNKLPADFRYAGLISGSGAIMDINLINNRNKLPMMLFHGTSDAVVPYATASHRSCKTNASGWMILFGSYSIYNHVVSLSDRVRLYTYCGGGHEYAGALFYRKPQKVVDFLNDVIAGERFQEHVIIPTGKPYDRSLPYRFCD